MSDVTRILSQVERGNQEAAEQLLPLVYDELRRLATAKMVREQPGQTLQATALVHEAYLRLVGGPTDQQWASRRHFFGAAAESMRRILIESARHKKSQKAGGDMHRVELADMDISIHHSPDDLLALDEALAQLIAEEPMAGEIAKLRLFAGMNVDEAAEILGLSRRTGFRHWTYARAFLQLRVGTNEKSAE